MTVIGPSGSGGKTTLLNLVAGIITPVSGAVQVGDLNISDLNDAGRRDFRITNIGLVFQDSGLFDYLECLLQHPAPLMDLQTVVAEGAFDF